MSDRTRKLVALRARTNYDLLVLVQREIHRGLALVDVATTRNSPLFAQAEKAFAAAAAMFPRISGMSQDDQVQIEARLKELRSRLDQMPAYANLRPYPASFAS
jgi:hypothetical protein